MVTLEQARARRLRYVFHRPLVMPQKHEHPLRQQGAFESGVPTRQFSRHRCRAVRKPIGNRLTQEGVKQRPKR